jgi:uncharacterized protein YegL
MPLSGVALVVLLPLISGAIGCSRSSPEASTQSARSVGVAPPTEVAALPTSAPVAAATAPAEEKGKGSVGPSLTDPAAPSPSPGVAARRTAGAPKPAAPSAVGAGAGVGALAAPFVPAASVKAGEWDDNANYREFQRFLTSSQTDFHRVDLRDRRFLVVRDSKGQAVPRCKVSVSNGQNAATSYLTTASGRAIFFPHAEGFSEGKMTATADCADGKAQAAFAIGPNDPDGLVDLRLQSERKTITGRTIDVAFVLDTTGSMGEEIAAVKQTIQKVASALGNDQTQVRIGLVEYKDRGDTFVTKAYPFSSDLPGFSQKVAQISAGGGGDTPEDMNAGLHTALTQLQWSDQSVARLAFVVGDAPPHLDYKDGPDYAQDMKRASHRGIQLFTVAASGMDSLGQVVFRQMAQFTGGTNMFVLRGGAGPQSVGGGDPGSSCGGTHTNYSSGKLDELIVQKIRRELKSLDGDPMRIAGLKTDENAKPCEDRVVFKD